MASEKRLIYADSGQESVEYLKKHLIVDDSDFLRGYLQGVEALANGLATLPPVDAVEVVRCKDCKHWKHLAHLGCTDFVKLCSLANYMIGANGYCLYGERKDNG